MRVAVEQQDRAVKRACSLGQPLHDALKSGPAPAAEHVRVHREHDGARVLARGFAERLVEPGQVGREPAGELRLPRRALRRGLTPLKPRLATVVPTDDVQRRDDGAAISPHHVLGEFPKSLLARLGPDRHRLPAERHAGP